MSTEYKQTQLVLWPRDTLTLPDTAELVNVGGPDSRGRVTVVYFERVEE